MFVPLWRFACLLLGATLPWLVDYRVHGREHIPPRGGVLVVCNHVGDIDPPFVGFACHPRPAQYMALAKHFTRLPLALLLFGLGAFPVRTGEPDTRALRYARDRLERGRLVIIFPEGGPLWGAPLGAFQEGAGLLALTPGVTVVPAAITGTERVMRGWRVVGRGPVHVTFGPPVEVPAEGPRRARAAEATERARAAVAALLGDAGAPGA